MTDYQPTGRTKLNRLPKRGAFDEKTVHAILDAAFVAHVGFVHDGQPIVLPMIYGREGRTLYLHGSAGGRAFREMRGGIPVCVTVTLVDGLVLARSAFHHSMNYRSVVAMGKAVQVDDAEKSAALRVISEHFLRGRWTEAREPNLAELKQTTVLRLPLSECSAKVRTGPPLDDEEDYALPIWAGVVPVTQSFGVPQPDPRLDSATAKPASLKNLR